MSTASEIAPRRSWLNTLKSRGVLGEAAVYLGAIMFALVLNGVFIALAGGNVLKAYQAILHASLGSEIGIAQTLNKWSPLLFGGLAVALGFRGGFSNIGVDGQLYMGAIFATGTGFLFASANLPPYIFVPLVLLAGGLGGGLYAAIPGFLKARFRVNEIFVTVMLNSIAIFLVEYLSTGPWNDPMAGEAITNAIPTAAILPKLIGRGGGHMGIFLAWLMAFGLFWLLNKTTLGYKIRAVGDNPQAAIIGGINYPVIAFVTLALTGVLAGLGGAVEVAGVHNRLILGLSPYYGTMSILIAAVGKSSPVGVVLASLFFAILFVGSDSLQRSVGLPASAVLVFQAVVFLVILFATAYRELRSK